MMPTPALTQIAEVPQDESIRADLRSLGVGPGVFVLEDCAGTTLALATTANVRRAVAARLEPASAAGPTRRINYRQLTRTVRAVSVGSAFEADWAYLQLARERSPGACRLAMDRWQSWFVHGDPSAGFPQWTKTAHPTREGGVHLGPFPDKNATARYMDLLNDAFDLCRYHHILVQAPNATACAYKEMGKCPAPCDGSVSLDHYRKQVQAAIDFASTPIDQYRSQIEGQLAGAAEDQDAVAQQKYQTLLDRTAEAAKPTFSQVDRLDRFRFIAVMPSQRTGWARVFVILGGWIEPWVDVPADTDPRDCAEIYEQLLVFARAPVTIDSQASHENLSLVCWHLFRPAKARKHEPGRFLRLNPEMKSKAFEQAIRVMGKATADDSHSSVPEQFTEGASEAHA